MPMLMPGMPIGSSEPQVSFSESSFRHGVSAVSQRPDRSGFPSAVFGAGALRLGFPSAVFGTPAVGYLNHCADTVSAAIAMVANNTNRMMDVRMIHRRYHF